MCDFFTLYVGFFLSSGWSFDDKIVSIKPGTAASIYWHYRFHRSRRLPTRHLLATVQCWEMNRYSIICRTLDLEQFDERFQSYRTLCLFFFSFSVYQYNVLIRRSQIVSENTNRLIQTKYIVSRIPKKSMLTSFSADHFQTFPENPFGSLDISISTL